MTDHPILFQGDMVRAIMTCSQCGTITLEIECPKCGSKERRKTQTRRPVDPQPPSCYADGKPLVKPFVYCGPHLDKHWHGWKTDDRHGHGIQHTAKSPHGVPGDLLWAKEPFQILNWDSNLQRVIGKYTRGGDKFNCRLTDDERDKWLKWKKPYSAKSSLFMFKSLARLWLKVLASGVERVQEISEADAKAEGVCDAAMIKELACRYEPVDGVVDSALECQMLRDPRVAFENLWDSIYAKPKPVMKKKEIVAYVSYPWAEIRETRKHRGKPWYVHGNPHVFKATFERYDKE